MDFSIVVTMAVLIGLFVVLVKAISSGNNKNVSYSDRSFSSDNDSGWWGNSGDSSDSCGGDSGGDGGSCGGD